MFLQLSRENRKRRGSLLRWRSEKPYGWHLCMVYLEGWSVWVKYRKTEVTIIFRNVQAAKILNIK